MPRSYRIAMVGACPFPTAQGSQVLIRQMSELVAVTTVEQDDGSLNEFIGSGQALVIGGDARNVQTQPNAFDPTRLDVAISNGATSVVITDEIQGGRIGGALDFLDEVLEPARRSLGRIAVVLAGTFNEQHRLGQDLDGGMVPRDDTDPEQHLYGSVTLIVRTLRGHGARPDPARPPERDARTERPNWGSYPIVFGGGRP